MQTPSPTPVLIQIPRPGTHYSAIQGSAIAQVIYEMARAGHKQGMSTRVVLKRGVASDYSIGQSDFVDFGAPPRRWQRRMDDFLASKKRPRFFLPRFWKPALDAIESDFDGPVFFHDSMESLHHLKAARPHAKICAWLHNYKWRHLEEWELKRAFAATHRIVCVSDFVAQALLRECGALCDDLAAKVVVVLNGVDTERFQPIAHPAPSASNPVVITFAGRVVEKKGVHLLLEAAQILQSRATTPFEVRLIGSKSIQSGEAVSPYERGLHAQAQALGERLKFIGAVASNAMPAHFGASDIVCVPSLWDDPCPLVALEAMASGCALVTTRRGGIPEEAGDAAHYFDPPSGESLAAELTRLIENPALLAAARQKSRQRALQLTWGASFQSLRDRVL